ncbi:NACHT domain-containing protein [Streptomyces cinnamoneus]|uniref:NACHT domain-containing protein n=1 Tax=Streptomyces cinnamoneus TaxID=53446 RepID=UPI001E5B1FB4|nr:NACHT domain-containing protein [Streptomyces cinnamoneus]
MLVWVLSEGREVAEAVSALVAAVVGLFGLLAPWAWDGRPRGKRSTNRQVDDAAEALANQVRRQWESEAELRQLFDPAPLPILWWDSAVPDVSDHRHLIGDPISCRADAPQELAAALRRLPHQRLAVLGSAGSGKTTFAVLLTLALLRERTSRCPVPVLFSLASFDPSRESALRWLARQISSNYPALANVGIYGATAVGDLLADHRVLPVLDGLDELPQPSHSLVLAALNNTLPAQAPLVLTCRTQPYISAVAEAGVLTGAAVIEPAPLNVSDALDLLRLAAQPGRPQGQWDALAEHVNNHPDGPAAQALQSPLLVALARTVYADADHDPAELTDATRFPTRAIIEHHLLDALVPSLYSRAHLREPADRRWRAEDGMRYLRHLAHGLNHQETHDFAWWQLYRWVPALARNSIRAMVWSLFLAALILLGYGGYRALDPGFVWPLKNILLTAGGIAMALFCMQCLAVRDTFRATTGLGALGAAALMAACGALTNALVRVLVLRALTCSDAAATTQRNLEHMAVYGLGFFVVLYAAGPPVPPHMPSRGSFTLQNWKRQLLRAGGIIIGSGALCSVVFNFYVLAGIVKTPDHTGVSPVVIWEAGWLAGVFFGMVLAFVRLVRSATSRHDVTNPVDSLRADWLIAMVSAAAGAVLIMLPDNISLPLAFVVERVGLDSVPADFLLAELSDLLVVGASGFALALIAFAWPHYSAARVLMTIRGQTPLRLQAFLADAHRLGILRQVGPVYQFRHASLQQRLAGQDRVPGPRNEPSDSTMRMGRS